MIRISDPTDDLTRISPILRHLRATLPDPDYHARLAAALEAGYRALLAEKADTVLGCLGFQIHRDVFWGKTFYIDDLVVLPQARSQGVGATLLDSARTLAQARACDHIRLASGLTRADAHRFYEANGMSRASYQFALALPPGSA